MVCNEMVCWATTWCDDTPYTHHTHRTHTIHTPYTPHTHTPHRRTRWWYLATASNAPNGSGAYALPLISRQCRVKKRLQGNGISAKRCWMTSSCSTQAVPTPMAPPAAAAAVPQPPCCRSMMLPCVGVLLTFCEGCWTWTHRLDGPPGRRVCIHSSLVNVLVNHLYHHRYACVSGVCVCVGSKGGGIHDVMCVASCGAMRALYGDVL